MEFAIQIRLVFAQSSTKLGEILSNNVFRFERSWLIKEIYARDKTRFCSISLHLCETRQIDRLMSSTCFVRYDHRELLPGRGTLSPGP